MIFEHYELVYDRTKIFTEPPNRTEPDFFCRTEQNRTEPNLNRTIFIPEIIILLKNLLFLASALHAEDYFRSQKQHFAKL